MIPAYGMESGSSRETLICQKEVLTELLLLLTICPEESTVERNAEKCNWIASTPVEA